MKRTILSIICLSAILSLSAQNRVGIIAGYNLGGVYSHSAVGVTSTPGSVKLPPEPDWKMTSGFQGGLLGEFPLTDNDNFFIQAAAMFTMQGFQDKYKNDQGNDCDRIFRFFYIHVPVNFQYKINIGIPKLILQAGPFAQYGLFGRQQYKLKGVNKELDDQYKKLKFGEDKVKDNITPAFQYGVGLGVGVQLQRVALTAGYDFNLANFHLLKDAKSRNYDAKLKTGNIWVNLTILFGKYAPIFPEE